MSDLPVLEDLLREKAEANKLMLASVVQRSIRCSGCGETQDTNIIGMLAGYELLKAGWTTDPPRCPGCSELF